MREGKRPVNPVVRAVGIGLLLFSLVLIGFGILFMRHGFEMILMTLLFMGGGLFLLLSALSLIFTGRPG